MLKRAIIGKIAILEQSMFYIPVDKSKYINPNDKTEEEQLRRVNLNHNFDNPSSIDWDLFEEAIQTLINKKNFKAPTFDQKLKLRNKETIEIEAANVLVIDGTMLLYRESIRNKLDIKIFVETDDDVRLSRRLLKHLEQDEYFNLQEFLEANFKFVKPGHEEFVEPTKKFADIIIPNYGFSLEESKLGRIIYE